MREAGAEETSSFLLYEASPRTRMNYLPVTEQTKSREISSELLGFLCLLFHPAIHLKLCLRQDLCGVFLFFEGVKEILCILSIIPAIIEELFEASMVKFFLQSSRVCSPFHTVPSDGVQEASGTLESGNVSWKGNS